MKTLSKYTKLVAGLLAGALSSFGAGSKALTPASVDTLVEPYLKIQTALAGDDLETAQSGARDFLKAVDKDPQEASLKGLQNSAGALAEAEDIVSARAAFLGLSNGLIEVVRKTGTANSSALYVAHCPMAFGGKGGDWLQSEITVANPYYGASMLRCGGINEELGKGANKPHQMDKESMDPHKGHSHGMMDKTGKGNPHSGMDMDAIHAGVPGYAAKAESKQAAGGCQMACCAAVN